MKKLISILLVSLFLFYACKPVVTPVAEEPVAEEPILTEISIDRNEFRLEWDETDAVDGFNIYYKGHGENDWALLGYSTTTSFLVHEGILPKGTYDFAVTSVLSGEESDKHTSLDKDAILENGESGGWYLEWI